jgi:hypothetical protein
MAARMSGQARARLVRGMPREIDVFWINVENDELDGSFFESAIAMGVLLAN